MISKPSWLVTFLASLQVDILTWHIDIGGPIEGAIDWVLGPINELAAWANQVWAWWEEFRQEVLDFVNLVGSRFGELWNYVWALADTALQQVLTWWEAASETVRGWIEAAVELVWDQVRDLWGRIEGLWIMVTTFFSDILPGLARLADVDDLIRSALAPLAQVLDWFNAFGRDVADFLTAPWDWLWERFGDWFLGPER